MDLAGILAGAKEMGGDAKAGFYAGNMTGRVQPDMPPSPLLAALMGMLPGSDQGSAPAIMHELDPSTAYMGGRTAGAGAHGAREMTRGLAEALAPENVGSMVGGAVGNVESMLEGDGSRLGFDTSRAMDDGVEAVMSKIMGVGDQLKSGFQQGRAETTPPPQETPEQQIQRMVAERAAAIGGAPQQQPAAQEPPGLAIGAGSHGDPSVQVEQMMQQVQSGVGPNASKEELDAELMRLLEQRRQMIPELSQGEQFKRDFGQLGDALKRDFGPAVDAVGGALGGAKDAIGGMAGNVMESLSPYIGGGGGQQAAAGGPDPATIQQLQQILSPEELQAVMQDPQKMAEIQALLQQGMGGQ